MNTINQLTCRVRKGIPEQGRPIEAVVLALTLSQLMACASQPNYTELKPSTANQEPVAHVSEAPTPEEAFGIRVDGLRLSAHGYVLDLRYRVLDPAKAAPLLDSKRKVYLLDENHGAKLGVPQSPKIGGMRQTSRNYVIYTDRDYFILFANPGRAVKSGDTLKLAVEDTGIAALKVQ